MTLLEKIDHEGTATTGRDWPVAVVGSGTMGAGIAEACARAGCRVVVVDTAGPALARAHHRVGASVRRAFARGQLLGDVDEVLSRLQWSTSVEDVSGARVVIEAIREDVDDKVDLVRQLEAVVAPQTLIASNTSSIPIARIASAARHPERFLGLHFFNPAQTMPLVEVIGSLTTDPHVVEDARRFVGEVLRKRPVVAPDRAGFLVNALLVPYLLASIRSLENGIASREDIDSGMVDGCGMPMGPLRLADLIGLDTLCLVADCLYAEHLDPAYAAPSLLRRHVDAGLLGRKTGHGFYRYGP